MLEAVCGWLTLPVLFMLVLFVFVNFAIDTIVVISKMMSATALGNRGDVRLVCYFRLLQLLHLLPPHPREKAKEQTHIERSRLSAISGERGREPLKWVRLSPLFRLMASSGVVIHRSSDSSFTKATISVSVSRSRG
jgi:hypothetical protein